MDKDLDEKETSVNNNDKTKEKSSEVDNNNIKNSEINIIPNDESLEQIENKNLFLGENQNDQQNQIEEEEEGGGGKEGGTTPKIQKEMLQQNKKQIILHEKEIDYEKDYIKIMDELKGIEFESSSICSQIDKVKETIDKMELANKKVADKSTNLSNALADLEVKNRSAKNSQDQIMRSKLKLESKFVKFHKIIKKFRGDQFNLFELNSFRHKNCRQSYDYLIKLKLKQIFNANMKGDELNDILSNFKSLFLEKIKKIEKKIEFIEHKKMYINQNHEELLNLHKEAEDMHNDLSEDNNMLREKHVDNKKK